MDFFQGFNRKRKAGNACILSYRLGGPYVGFAQIGAIAPGFANAKDLLLLMGGFCDRHAGERAEFRSRLLELRYNLTKQEPALEGSPRRFGPRRFTDFDAQIRAKKLRQFRQGLLFLDSAIHLVRCGESCVQPHQRPLF